MKKAEQWAYENQNTIHSIADVIRMAQIEAIHETVLACAESAEAYYNDAYRKLQPATVDKDSIPTVEQELISKL